MSRPAVIAIGAGDTLDLPAHHPLSGIRIFHVDVGLVGRRPGDAISFSIATRKSGDIIPFLRSCSSGECDLMLMEDLNDSWSVKFIAEKKVRLSVPIGQMSQGEALDRAKALVEAMQTAKGVVYADEPRPDHVPSLC